ncbi:hypothetical protein EPUS_08384 [Endocarpon pusillum Z07020]|uniref:Uncharacterized protein n=1 Tax=Endocarpon pusillum (strain Z07020 / HMAS-L-300199) TaxID=1263415 RepID=U1HJD4_ENDPU|nr:uncharacterized protein EPUS_08384 [Endocarpon pusillum Z07020]ERF69034.1 hypothetical protein EPUS_08384 [Endocarpon pusillum Z07020]
MDGVKVRQSDSDVSASSCNTSTPDTKHALQSNILSAIKQRLAELDAADDILVTGKKKLNAERELEDASIRKRREREDAEYQQKEEAHDHEEDELRRKLKNLKRGLPVDEKMTENHHASTVSESMYPPAKKHQPNPAPMPALNPPSRPNAMQPLQPTQQDKQPKPSYYGWNAYGPGETYAPQNQAHPPQHNQLQPSPLPNGGQPSFNPPAPPPEYGPSPKQTTPLSHAQSPRQQAPTPAPPPPPPPPLGSPSVNPPPRQTIRTPIQPASQPRRGHQSSAKAQALALEAVGSHPPVNSPTASTSTLSGKPKAFITHSYSRSETFANRYHYCERTDELDRGIWTYFGPGGTKEAPTVAGKEMYLRCNHDDCMRIDWKTVQGLKSHIVKHHGIPRGTIDSLELALEKYGVPVQDIEDHEKKHGLGFAGTMAEKGTRGSPRASRPSNEIVFDAGVDHSPIHPAVNSPTRKRRHTCAYTDNLGRGIWTYLGPGVPNEAAPVAGKKKMYLRCNFDHCMKIGHKTVTGLNSHLWKKHDAPAVPMAGGLKAIFKTYGVEVLQIEKYEREHGHGSAGTTTVSPKAVSVPAAGPRTILPNNPLPADTRVASSPPAVSLHFSPSQEHGIDTTECSESGIASDSEFSTPPTSEAGDDE